MHLSSQLLYQVVTILFLDLVLVPAQPSRLNCPFASLLLLLLLFTASPSSSARFAS